MISILSTTLSSTAFTAIGYTLMHSLWQGAVLVLLVNLYQKATSKSSPVLRYNVAFATLLLMFLAAIFTFLYFYIKFSGLGAVENYAPVALTSTLATEANLSQAAIHSILLPGAYLFFPIVSGLWVAGVFFFSSRLLLGFSFTYHVKKSLEFDLPPWLQSKMKTLTREYSLERPIRVALSNRVISPLLIGFIKPIVIFPVAAINQLSPNEIEMIIRHEIGHIIRNDYLQNIAIRLIEVLMFYHPCVWWITNILKKERENHCDDYVLAGSPDRLSYAKTLFKIRELQTQHSYGLALAFSDDNKTLLNRIKRILNQKQNMSLMKGNLIVFALLIAAVLGISATGFLYNSNSTAKPESIEKKKINAFDLESYTFPLQIIAKKDTTKEEIEKMRAKRAEARAERAERKRELRDNMRALREELRELHRSDRSHSTDLDLDEEWEEEFETKMEEFGKQMEEMGKRLSERFNDEEFHLKMEKLGKELEHKFNSEEFKQRMKEMGERLEGRFDNEEFQKKMEELGKRLDDRFDSEEFKKKMEKWEEEFEGGYEGEEFEKHMEEFGECWADHFDNAEFHENIAEIAAWGSELGMNIAAEIMESLPARQLAWQAGFDPEIQEEIEKAMEGIHYDFDYDFDHNFEYDFGDLGENIGEMAFTIVEGVFEGLEDIHDAHLHTRSEESTLVDRLVQELKSDGFYDNKKVNFRLEKDQLKINGKSQSKEITDKYKRLISSYSDMHFENEKKFILKYSEKNGKKKSSWSIEN